MTDPPRLTNRLDAWSGRYARLTNVTTTRTAGVVPVAEVVPTGSRVPPRYPSEVVVTIQLDPRVDVDLVVRRLSATLSGLDREAAGELEPPKPPESPKPPNPFD